MFFGKMADQKMTLRGYYTKRTARRTVCLSQSGVKVLPRYLSDCTPSCHDFCKYGMKHILEKKAKCSSPKKFQLKPCKDQEDANPEFEKESSKTSVDSKCNEAPARANSLFESPKPVDGGRRRRYSEVLLQSPIGDLGVNLSGDSRDRRHSCICTSKELAAFRSGKASDWFPSQMSRPQDLPEKTLYVIETKPASPNVAPTGKATRSKPSRSASQSSTERSFKNLPRAKCTSRSPGPNKATRLPIRPSSTSSSSSYNKGTPRHPRRGISNAPSSSSSSVSLFSRSSPSPTPSESVKSGSVSKRAMKKPNNPIPKAKTERVIRPIKVEKAVSSGKDGSPRKVNPTRGKLAQAQAVNSTPRSPRVKPRRALDENHNGKTTSIARTSSSSSSLLSSSSPPQNVTEQENHLENTKLKRIVVPGRVGKLITEDKVVSPRKLNSSRGKAVGVQSKNTSPRSPRSPKINQRRALGEKQIGNTSNRSPISRPSSSSSVLLFSPSPPASARIRSPKNVENRLANKKMEPNSTTENVADESKRSGSRSPRMKQRKGLGDNQNGKVIVTNRRTLKKAASIAKCDISEPRTPKVVLRHQSLEEGKRSEQSLLNNVIERTATKLAEARKSKVKALVGAFETVISLHDTKSTATTGAA